MNAFVEWLMSIGATRQALFIAATGFLIIGLGFLFIWLGTRGDEYRGVRRRWRTPDPYDRDPCTGEFLVPPGTFDEPEPVADRTQVLRKPTVPTNDPFPPFVSADVPNTKAEVRHRLEDTQGMTTNLGAYAAAVKRYNARAMVPQPPRAVGEERRTLRADWREEFDDGDYPR